MTAPLARRNQLNLQPKGRKVVLKPYLEYPDLSCLPVRVSMVSFENVLEAIGAKGGLVFTAEHLLSQWSSGPIEQLQSANLNDDLSAFLQLSADPLEKLVERSSFEFDACLNLWEKCSCLSLPEFVWLIMLVHRAVAPGPHNFRLGEMRTKSDASFNMVIFPSAHRIPELLQTLQYQLSASLRDYPASAALITYVALIHCHPFADGNGRTARAIFNLILSRSVGAPVFVPLSILSQITQGNFVLKVRRALYLNDWSPLFYFMSSSLKHLVSVQ